MYSLIRKFTFINWGSLVSQAVLLPDFYHPVREEEQLEVQEIFPISRGRSRLLGLQLGNVLTHIIGMCV